MDEPKAFLTIIRRAVKSHPESIDDAVTYAVRAVYAIPASDSLVRTLIEIAVRRRIEQHRHQLNVDFKNNNGEFATKPKVRSGAGPAVARVSRSLYEYFIGGMTVGSMTCADIVRIEKTEAATANGHQANANLLGKLKGLVPTGKTVREAVSETKLRTLMRSAGVL